MRADVRLIFTGNKINGVLIALRDTIHLLSLVGVTAKPDAVGKGDAVRLQQRGLAYLVAARHAQLVCRLLGTCAHRANMLEPAVADDTTRIAAHTLFLRQPSLVVIAYKLRSAHVGPVHQQTRPQ